MSVIQFDTREVVRVARSLEELLRQAGGHARKGELRQLLPEGDWRYAGQAWRHLALNGKVTVVGHRVRLGRAA